MNRPLPPPLLLPLLLLLLLLCPLSPRAELRYAGVTASSLGLDADYRRVSASVDGVPLVIDRGKTQSSLIYMTSVASQGSPGELYNTSPVSGLRELRVTRDSGAGSYSVYAGGPEGPSRKLLDGCRESAVVTFGESDTYFKVVCSRENRFSRLVLVYDDASSSPPVHPVSCVSSPAGGGSVSASPPESSAGVPVSVSASPSPGFWLGSLSASDGAGTSDISLSGSFVMPSRPVTVTGVFLPSPAVVPSSGEVAGGALSGVSVSGLAADDGCVVRYTTDGSLPGPGGGAVYGGPFDVRASRDGEEVVVRAVALSPSGLVSGVAESRYTFRAPAPPVFAPPSGSPLAAGVPVFVSSADGGSLRVLVDPADAPGCASAVFSSGSPVDPSSGLSLPPGAHTVWAAVDLGGLLSWSSARYDVPPSAPWVRVVPGGRTVTDPVTVSVEAGGGVAPLSLSCSVDGGPPRPYEGPFLVDRGCSVTAFVTDASGSVSSCSAEYAFAESALGDFLLVASESDLVEGREYLIVSRGSGLAMGVSQGLYSRASVPVSLGSGGLSAAAGESAQVVTLERSGGLWLLNAGGGYLYAASSSADYLRTGDSSQASVNGRAAIALSSGGDAVIAFQGGHTHNSIRLAAGHPSVFSCFLPDSPAEPVSLYWRDRPSLSSVVRRGVPGRRYTVSDGLLVVHAGEGPSGAFAVARGLAPSPASSGEAPPPGAVDYAGFLGLMPPSASRVLRDWVLLDFSRSPSEEFSKLSGAGPGSCVLVRGGTLSGVYSDSPAPALLVDASCSPVCSPAPFSVSDSLSVYAPCNYHSSPLQRSLQDPGGRLFWLSPPRAGEVAWHTWSVWGGDGFYMPERACVDGRWHNTDGLLGAYAADLGYNVTPSPGLVSGEAYSFLGLVLRPGVPGPDSSPSPSSSSSPGAPSRVGVQPGSSPGGVWVVAPLDLDPGSRPGQVVTGSPVVPASSSPRVTYHDLAGRRSSSPFRGVNIVVTLLPDGSSSARRAVFP